MFSFRRMGVGLSLFLFAVIVGCGGDSQTTRTAPGSATATDANMTSEATTPLEPDPSIAHSRRKKAIAARIAKYYAQRAQGRRSCHLVATNVLENETKQRGEEARAACEARPAPKALRPFADLDRAVVTRISIQGSRARAIVTDGSAHQRVLMQHEDGVWRIAGTREQP